MKFEILSIVLTVIFFILGTKRGFIYEFFCMFKYLLIMFLMKYSYRIVQEIFRLDDKVSKNGLNKYLIVFIILYLIFSIMLSLSGKFLRSIKLQNGDEILGGILGIVKTTFIIFIIYIIVLVGSEHSKRLKEIRNESKLVSRITEYVYAYAQGFPEFIQKEVNAYRMKIKEEELEKNVLNALKDENLETKNTNKGIKK